jgi:NADP-dependent 3-hydroxy acid dehydrogenase YdfG
MLTSVQGKSVVVTGASKGIGKGIARVFAKNGAKVLVVARHADQAEATAKELGNGASAFAADVTKLADLEKMAKTAADRQSGIDILCANAGIFPQARIEDMSPEQWDEVLSTNLKGTFLSVKACVPYLKKTGAGRIVITSSITGPITGFPGWTHYGASKSGQLGRAREIRDHRQRGDARQHHHRGARRLGRRLPKNHGGFDPAEAARDGRGHRLRRAVPRVEGGGLHHGADDRGRRRTDSSGVAGSAEGLTSRASHLCRHCRA